MVWRFNFCLLLSFRKLACAEVQYIVLNIFELIVLGNFVKFGETLESQVEPTLPINWELDMCRLHFSTGQLSEAQE